MATTAARLTVGFEADATYDALSPEDKVNFKAAFWSEASSKIAAQVSATMLNSWASFPVTTNAYGGLDNATIVKWMNYKLGDAGPLTVQDADAGSSRYVWVNGERYCEHVFRMRLDGGLWLLPAVSMTKQMVVLTLGWRTEVPSLVEPA